MHTIDYLKFLNHCQKEFCSENLLFIALMVQWQHFLIEHNLWPRKINGELDTTLQIMDSSKVLSTMNVLPIFSRLEDRMATLEARPMDVDYCMFIPIIELIYKKYIEMGKAPFEVNISFETRDKIRGHFDYIKNDRNYLNGETFWQLWNDLLSVCEDIFEMIPAPLMRCFRYDCVLSN